MSYRKLDTHIIEIFNEYVDEKIYPFLIKKLNEEYKFMDVIFKRIDDKNEQLAGIDVKLYGNIDGAHHVINIDEKAQIYYMNKSMNSFVFEIDSYQKGILREGWFFNDELKTTHYLLLWPKSDIDKKEINKIEDFKSCECYLIPKIRIKDYFESKGFNKEDFENKAKQIRIDDSIIDDKDDKNRKYWYYISKDREFWITYSYGLEEMPINIVVKKDVLKKIASLIISV